MAKGNSNNPQSGPKELQELLTIPERRNEMAKAKAKEEEANTNTVGTADLASEFGYTGPYLRKVLREGKAEGRIEHEPRTRWAWEEGSSELDQVRAYLSEHKEKAEAAAAESDDDEEDDDEDFDDEDE